MQSSNFYPPPSSSQNYHLLGQQPDDRFKYTSGPSVMQPSSSTPTPDILTTSNSQATSLGPQDLEDEDELVDEDSGDTAKKPGKRSGRRKIKIEYINDKTRRHITFSKRKAGIMKKAYELSTLTGTQVLLLVVSETGLV
ncbi:hypothetical protein [Absidia glauca]|uniref:MADS-box domain-containing protein n=1 Tax=Absidia glauca TaxID=4829 RepID=A0A163JJ26_ABSGL|nr:hypothetical protein [Absidia glauca]